MKRALSILLIFCTLFSLASCALAHEHTYGDWVTVRNVTYTHAGKKERTCSCGEKEIVEIPSKSDELLAFMKTNSSDYTSGGYTIRANPKSFGKNCRLIYPGYTVEGGLWNIALTFDPSTKTTIFLISYGDASSLLDTLAFSVNNGEVIDGITVTGYTYLFQNELMGYYKDQISGHIYPSSLNSSTELYYDSYTAGSDRAFKYYVEGYQKDACAYAKQLVIFFNAYFESKGLSLTMRDFGFSE